MQHEIIVSKRVTAAVARAAIPALATGLCALTLSACGGGGSNSTSSGASPSPTASAPPAGTNGAAATVFALQNGGTLTVNADGTATFVQGATSANLSPTLNGTPPAFSAPNFANGDTLFQQSGMSSRPGLVLERMGRSAGLSVSDFGAWVQNDPATGNVVATGFFAGGSVPATNIPSSGTATYNGSYIGTAFARSNPANSMPISGGLQLSANFGSSSISSTFTSGALADPTKAPTQTGSISGTSFTTGGNAAAYVLHGQFFGAGATEATGTMGGSLSGQTDFSGAFGAHR
jgi:hypothetical protein